MNQVVHVEQTSTATPERVFALLGTVTTWPSWSSFDEAGLERPGAVEPDGVGAIRRFRRGRVRSREEVVAYEAPRRFGYTLLAGLPLRDYRADVTLVPAPGGGTTITWHSTFRPKVPGSGWLYRIGLARFIRKTARQLAHAAEA